MRRRSGAARPAQREVRLREDARRAAPGGRAGLRAVDRLQARALAVYLLVLRQAPVERCRQLIADMAGAAVSEGFIHSCLARAASLAAEVVGLIRALITAARGGFDETRCGRACRGEDIRPRRVRRAVLCLVADARSLDSMQMRGSCRYAGIVLRRNQSYSTPGGSTSPRTRRACLTCCGTMRTAPRATGRGPARAGAAGAARPDPCLARRPRAAPGRHPRGVQNAEHELRHADLAGWQAFPASPARRTARSRSPAASCWNSAATAAATCCCSPRTPACGPRITSASAACAPENPAEDIRPPGQRRRTQDRVDVRGYIDTARRHGRCSWTSCTTSCSAGPGDRPRRHSPVTGNRNPRSRHHACMG